MISRRSLLAGASSIAVVGPAFASLPGGHYLTPTNADDPIVIADITSTTLYSSPLLGESNAITVFDGSTFTIIHANQLALALSSSVHLANNVYPIFAGLTVNGPMIASGPAWQSIGYGSSTIGSTAATARDGISGLIVNAAQMQLYNGGFFTAAAGTWRLVGGIRPRANGVIGIDKSSGLNRRCDVWNMNNRQPVKLIATETGFYDTTTNPPTWHWFTTQIAPRNLNGNTNCYADVFTLIPSRVEAAYFQAFYPGAPYGVNYDTGIRLNNEVSSSGAQSWRGAIGVGGRWESHAVECKATIEGAFGLNKLSPCETVESMYPGQSSGSAEIFGQEFCCRCTVEYFG